MIEDLVARVFATRNSAHLAHWKTKSYAQHVALGDFYDGVIDKVDGLVEMCQGTHGLIGAVANQSHSPVNIVARLEDDAQWLADNRSEIAEDNTAIENAVDDLIGLYLSTLYKLKNLS